MAIAVLEAHRAAAMQKLLDGDAACSKIVGMPERGDRHAEQFAAAPAEDGGRRRIDADPVAVKSATPIRSSDDAPGRSALARADRNLLLQRTG